MDEKSDLLNEYQDYHLKSNSEITKEKLIEGARKFLSSVKPEDRFVYLDINFYEGILENIAQNFDRNEDSIQMIKAGFNSLEKYAVNLWKFPWRKEYHSIKVMFNTDLNVELKMLLIYDLH